MVKMFLSAVDLVKKKENNAKKIVFINLLVLAPSGLVRFTND